MFARGLGVFRRQLRTKPGKVVIMEGTVHCRYIDVTEMLAVKCRSEPCGGDVRVGRGLRWLEESQTRQTPWKDKDPTQGSES